MVCWCLELKSYSLSGFVTCADPKMCSWANEIKVFPYKDHHVTNCLPSSKNLGIEMQNSRYTGSDPRRAVRLEMLSIYHQTLTTGLTFSLCMLVVYFLEVFLLCKPMAFAS